MMNESILKKQFFTHCLIWTSWKSWEVAKMGIYILLILKLMLREAMWLSHGHTAKWETELHSELKLIPVLNLLAYSPLPQKFY